MQLDAEAATHLKPWLVRTLEPICDAEPGALAEYILALLKHNASETELRQELKVQLEEFLEKETSTFIDTLFTAIRTKSYLPYAASSPPPTSASSSSNAIPDGGIPIPIDALVTSSESESPDRGRKRGLDHGDSDFRPAKGPRLMENGQFGRGGRGGLGRGERGRMNIYGRPDFMDGGMNSAMDMGMQQGIMGNRNAYQPPGRGRGICRDYHNNGYCARGAYCKFSHGEDAVIPGMFPMNGMPGAPYGPMMGGPDMSFPMPGASNAPYNPHERMDMRPIPTGPMSMVGRPQHSRAPMLPRQGDANGPMHKPGELPVIQDLTPRIPDEEGVQAQVPPMNGAPQGMNGLPGIPGGADMGLPMNPMANGMRNGFRPPRNGPVAPKGAFGDAPSFRPERRNDKTLVVEKIPEDKLSLGAINDWFKRFGTVTNVAVDASGAKALVSFADHGEAHAAWKCEDAVFGNRFVKVFWHRPMEGHGQKGARALAASAELVAKVSNKDLSIKPATSATYAPSSIRKAASSTSAVSALAAKQQLLEKQIAEQKSLMEKLMTASGDEKKEVMARLRKLNEEMKPSAASPPAAASPVPPSKGSRGSTPRTDDQAQKEMERLDKELELHHATGATEGEGEESTEELKARLEKLKAEAASLGISPDGSESTHPYSSGSYRPYRGRGRGRSFFRGAMRGGPPRGSMKLDNRPKKLLVQGPGQDQLQSVRDWYETTGQVESIDTTDGGGLLVSFKSRAAAEQGLAKGTNIPIVGAVQVSWFTGQPSSTPSAPKTSAPTLASAADPVPERPMSPAPDDSHMAEEEEVAAGGWGDDEFGML